MRIPKIYLETTMFNYYFDKGRDGHEDTVRLFEAIREGNYEVYTSEYVKIELQKALEPKRSQMLALIKEFDMRVLAIGVESERLADSYIAGEAIPERFRFDGLHIAVASVHGLDYVLSYNFRHINRAKTKLLTGRINNEKGFGTVVICTAKEVLDDEQYDKK